MNKKLRRSSVYVLMGGACLYLGLLSLGGMYALIPSVPLAILSLVLSVAYEGEIYKQNLSNAMDKLTKPQNLNRRVARAYLNQLFNAHPEILKHDAKAPSYPQFFKDYINLLKKAHHSKMDKKKLADLEDWFAEVVFSPEASLTKNTNFQKKLITWLHDQKLALKPDQIRALEPDAWQKNRLWQKKLERYVAVPLSLLAALFSTLGSTYLLFETISIFPVLALIPLNFWLVLVLPIALIAGAAYGVLTYNCTTDFLLHDPFKRWGSNIKHMWNNHRKLEAIAVGIAFSSLNVMAAGLTVCTAGTWCTIVSENRSIYALITSLPKWVMGVVNPIVISVSSIIFNLQNTSSSFGMLKKLFSAPLSGIYNAGLDLKKEISKTWMQESWLQFINPFRLAYTLLFFPSRLVLFLGHVFSIGVTSDRVPGVSKALSAGVGSICETTEDAHYVFGRGCNGTDHSVEELLEEQLEGDGHNHDLDLPTLALQVALWPINFLARQWTSVANYVVTPPVAQPPEHSCHHHFHAHCHDDAQPTVTSPEDNWEKQHPIWFTNKYYQKNKATLSPASNDAVTAFAQQIAEKSSVIHALEEKKETLPSEFVRKLEARFG